MIEKAIIRQHRCPRCHKALLVKFKEAQAKAKDAYAERPHPEWLGLSIKADEALDKIHKQKNLRVVWQHSFRDDVGQVNMSFSSNCITCDYCKDITYYETITEEG